MSVVCETTTTPKHSDIDAAYCTFTNTNRTLCPNKCSVLPEEFKKANLPGNTCINGFYKCEKFDNDIDDCNIFKVGRATGLTLGKLLPIGVAVSIDLTNESIKFAKEQDKIPTCSDNDGKEIFIGYMKTPLIREVNKKRQQCAISICIQIWRL